MTSDKQIETSKSKHPVHQQFDVTDSTNNTTQEACYLAKGHDGNCSFTDMGNIGKSEHDTCFELRPLFTVEYEVVDDE